MEYLVPVAHDYVTVYECYNVLIMWSFHSLKNGDIALDIFNRKTIFKYFVYQSVINLFKVDESE